MIDPPRLFSDPESEVERSLLSAGRSYRASSRARGKVLAGVGLAGAATSSSRVASALGKAGVAKWFVAAVVTVGAAVPLFHYLSERHAPPTPVASVKAVPVAPPLALAAPPAAADPEPVLVAPTASAVRAPPRLDAKSPPLSAELSALDAARSSLANGDPSGALTALDAYSHKFPHGKLSLEAEVLRINALAKSGQTATARQRAAAFIKRHPDSLLAARVRALAGQ